MSASERRCLHRPISYGPPPPPPLHDPRHSPPTHLPPHLHHHPPPPPHQFHHHYHPPPHHHHPPPPPHHHHPPPPPHHHPPPPLPPHYYYEYYYAMPRPLPIGNKRRVLPYDAEMDHYYPRNLYSLSTREWFRFARIFAAKLVLEVFGAAGAIWGFSEVVTLRNNETQELWRMNACIVGVIFFLRYLCHAREYLYDIAADKLTSNNNSLELRVEEDPQTIVEGQPDEMEQFDHSTNDVNVSLISDNEHVAEQLNTV